MLLLILYRRVKKLAVGDKEEAKNFDPEYLANESALNQSINHGGSKSRRPKHGQERK